MSFKNKVEKSFERVKIDIEELRREIASLKTGKVRNSKVTRKSRSSTEAFYIASTTGKKFHKPKCLFARNIRNKVSFNSKESAKAKGYMACSCTK